MTEDLDVLGLLRKYENMDTLKKEAADEIERLRHELGMAHANLAMYIDCTAAAEIERLRTEVEHYKTLYYKPTMEATRES